MQKWGPITWSLFHTMAEKIKDEKYNTHFPQLWKHFTRICHSLPCPQCSDHATAYVRRYKVTQFSNKKLFKHFIHQFHNEVNNNTNKQLYDIGVLEIYKSNNLSQVFNDFIVEWNYQMNQKNMNLIAHNFIRKQTIKDFHIWFYSNLDVFDFS